MAIPQPITCLIGKVDASHRVETSAMRILDQAFPFMSPGIWIVSVLCVFSGGAITFWSVDPPSGLAMWTYARVHQQTYAGPIDEWNEHAETQGYEPVRLYVLDGAAQVRRTLSAFWSGTPVADVMEVEQDWIDRFFSGPVESIGFTDLTERLSEEGIYERINEPSFGLWSSDGRIFGIPHDVHPVVLAYREDLFAELGIDPKGVETWDDFTDLMHEAQSLHAQKFPNAQPLMPLSIWHTNMQLLETLMLQAGGGVFGSSGDINVASEANALVIATALKWCIGRDRIAIDAPEFSPSGNQLRLDGRVLCTVMPDWLAGVWKQDLPQLGGKLRLMPLPAWEPDGRRTSVMGGTMLAIPKSTEHFESAWAFAKHLYLSEEVAERLFIHNNMISPVVEYWDRPFYHVEDPYFSGQRAGSLFVKLAPEVPVRTSTPYRGFALAQVSKVIDQARNRLEEEPGLSRDELMRIVFVLLFEAEREVIREMNRNVFHTGENDVPD